MNPRIHVRDTASPKEWGTMPGMTWHHVVPFWLLRDVWNALVDQQIATQLPEAPVALRHFLVLSQRNWPNLDSLIDRMRAENTTQRRASHQVLIPLTEPERLELQSAAVWPAWNSVQGPSNRSDDPGDRGIDRFINGLQGGEPARMMSIDRLYTEFRAFVAAGRAPGPMALRALTGALAAARPTVYCENPIKFRPQMWVKEADGRWHKRRAGEA